MPPALSQLLDRLGGPRRAAIFAVGLAAAALIFGVARWATAPAWVPAFGNLPLESVGKMTEQLDQAGIEYRMEQGGTTITVEAGDLARARVALAQQGLPAAGRPGLELFDQPSWGMTDFTQRINYRRALEGELERTIGKMRGVEGAQVHLALHEQASFRRAQEKPAQASVVLRLASGQEPAQDVVQGITHLVASSVAGLEAANVTVLDDAGRLLTESGEDATLTGLSSQQLKVQREVEGYMERRAEQLVSQIVGAGNARVQVAAAVNFDKVDRRTEVVDPEKQATATEQRAEITPGAQGGAASTNVATAYENSRSTETFSGAIGNVRRITVAVLVNNRVLPAPAGADSTKAAAAPARTEPRTAEELARIETLVRSAVGADSARGDVVSVVNVPFDAEAARPVADAAPSPTLLETVQAVQKPAISVVGLLMVFAVALMSIRALRPSPAAVGAAALAAGTTRALGAPPADAAMLAAQAAIAAAPGALPALTAPAAPHPKLALAPVANPMREQAVAIAADRPDAAARLVRTWIREG